jgi:hypothetical protein
MFTPRCRFDNVDQFNKFIGIVATMDWSATPPPTWSCRHVILRPYTPHFSPVSTSSVNNPQHVSFWRAHHHGWRGTAIRGALRATWRYNFELHLHIQSSSRTFIGPNYPCRWSMGVTVSFVTCMWRWRVWPAMFPFFRLWCCCSKTLFNVLLIFPLHGNVYYFQSTSLYVSIKPNKKLTSEGNHHTYLG